jgi:hypothetical protein
VTDGVSETPEERSSQTEVEVFMFVVSNSMFGLLILSFGILGLIISFLIHQRLRYLTALALSGLLIALGVFFSVGTSLRQWRVARKIAKIQEQNRLTLEAIQSRLRQTPKTPAAEVSPTPAAPAPASPTPAPRRSPSRKK